MSGGGYPPPVAPEEGYASAPKTLFVPLPLVVVGLLLLLLLLRDPIWF